MRAGPLESPELVPERRFWEVSHSSEVVLPSVLFI